MQSTGPIYMLTNHLCVRACGRSPGVDNNSVSEKHKFERVGAAQKNDDNDDDDDNSLYISNLEITLRVVLCPPISFNRLSRFITRDIMHHMAQRESSESA